MCGRAAQSLGAVGSAAARLGAVTPNNAVSPSLEDSGVISNDGGHQESAHHDNNWNFAPGMKGVVFHSDHVANNKDETTCTPHTTASSIVGTFKVWGLVTRPGSKSNPLPTGQAQHFSNLMFNARSDTLYEKRTFRELALKGNTCVWAIDGFFEWKESDKDVLRSSSLKQPYFVHRSDGLPLLIAGLWTSVPTGRVADDGHTREILPTFTVLTTDACPSLRWLHHRQPVILWDDDTAVEWIRNPTQRLKESIAFQASSTTTHPSLLAWHPVTKKMSDMKYRAEECIQPIKIDRAPSVKSFFSKSPENLCDKNTFLSKCSQQQEEDCEQAPNTSGLLKKRSQAEPVPSLDHESKKVKTLDSFFVPSSQEENTKADHHCTSIGLSNSNHVPRKGSIASFFTPKSERQ